MQIHNFIFDRRQFLSNSSKNLPEHANYTEKKINQQQKYAIKIEAKNDMRIVGSNKKNPKEIKIKKNLLLENKKLDPYQIKHDASILDESEQLYFNRNSKDVIKSKNSTRLKIIGLHKNKKMNNDKNAKETQYNKNIENVVDLNNFDVNRELRQDKIQTQDLIKLNEDFISHTESKVNKKVNNSEKYRKNKNRTDQLFEKENSDKGKSS